MPVFIRNPEIDQQLDELARQQPQAIGSVKRTPLAEAIIKASIERCRSTGNPLAWMFAPAPQAADAQANTDQVAVDPGNQPDSPPPSGSGSCDSAPDSSQSGG